MKTNRGRPNAVAVLWFGENVGWYLLVHRVTDDRPVDEIFGVKDRQTGNTVETRSREVEIISDTYHVRIGIVGVNDRIRVGL